MDYRSDRILAANKGIMALNAAIPLERARAKASACAGARNGTTVDKKSSSSAMIEPQTRKNARVCFGGAVVKNAQIAVLSKNNSGDGGGRSLCAPRSNSNNRSGTERSPQTYSSLERVGEHASAKVSNCNQLINHVFKLRPNVVPQSASAYNFSGEEGV